MNDLLAPILVALDGAEKALFWADYLLAALFIAALVMETVADQQQWDYQNESTAAKRLAKNSRANIPWDLLTVASGNGCATPITPPNKPFGSYSTFSPWPLLAAGSIGQWLGPFFCCSSFKEVPTSAKGFPAKNIRGTPSTNGVWDVFCPRFSAIASPRK